MSVFSVGVQAQTLPAVVVTATRVEQPLTDVVADVSIIDSETIERSGATGLADVLAQLPGIAMVRNGGLATSTDLFLRGGNNNQTAFFVDGIRVDSQSGSGGAYWNAIPLEQIDRIEVLRGPAAAIYGSDAVAGVVQIFTRKGETAFSPSVSMGIGSYGTHRLDAAFTGKNGDFDYAIGLGRELSEGFSARVITAPANPAYDRDGYSRISGNLKLGLKLDARHRIEWTALNSDVKGQYDFSATTAKGDDRLRYMVQTTALNWVADWSTGYRTKLSLGQSQSLYETWPYQKLSSRADTLINSYLLHNEWRFGARTLTVDLERREDRLENKSTTPVLTERSQNAVALGYGVRQGKHTLQLNVRHDDDSEFGGSNTGSAAYAHEFQSNWRVHASAGTAFRAPTLFQRFRFAGQPALQPERSKNVEVGVKYEKLGNSMGFVLYRNRVSDLIIYQTSPERYENISRAQMAGATLTAGTRVGKIRLRGSLDWLDATDQDTGKYLPRRARQQASVDVETHWSNWLMGAHVQLVGERYDDKDNAKRLLGYGLMSLSVSKQLTPEWRMLVRLDNAGNKAYALADGYATPGRSIFLGLKWVPR